MTTKPGSDASNEEVYWTEVAHRLRAIVGTNLCTEDLIAVMTCITQFTTKLRDGFVINQRNVDCQQIGFVGASVIAANLDRQNRDWNWWNREYPSVDKSTAAAVERLTFTLGQIARHQSVVHVGHG